MQYYTHNNEQISLSQQIGSGGEATVYEVQNAPSAVAKIYHTGKCPPEEKLRFMVANPPNDPTVSMSPPHVSIAWITDLVHDANGQVIGYIMPKISGGIPIHKLYSPRDRRQNFPGFTWRYLHRTARNLASAVAAIHAKGYVIGDLNESNILVQPSAMVTVIDTDSFQVQSTSGKIFRCYVGKPPYIAPEIQGTRLSTIDRTEEHDCFALGVMIFLLLMENCHPFLGDGDPAEVESRIKAGLFPYPLKVASPQPPPWSLPFNALHSEIQHRFQQCFDEGQHHPARRPKADEWIGTLKRAESNLIDCTQNPYHAYIKSQVMCTWCERTKFLHGNDPFPTTVQQPSAAKARIPVQQPLPSIPPQRHTLPHRTQAQRKAPKTIQQYSTPPQPAYTQQFQKATQPRYRALLWGMIVILISLGGVIIFPQIAQKTSGTVETRRNNDIGTIGTATVIKFRFFESGSSVPSSKERLYGKRFAKAQARHINWELDLKYPANPNRVNFNINEIWYSPNGTILTRQSVTTFADGGWTTSHYWHGWGWQEAGNWSIGDYRVDLYIEDKKIASDSFTIY